mmetsp:Transcript_9327/g.20754  ORF Transcript_9327/g.20754 Transcript_9327/m.20754 type:complete len:391 (-) Transcript_9327:76-1248(-)
MEVDPQPTEGEAVAAAMTDVDSCRDAAGASAEADATAVAPIVGPSARRARVELPEPDPDEGPTYYRIGLDHTYEAEDEEIHFQCTRIKKLENLEAAGPRLKRLILIANCIEKIENLESLINLEHLELYQNLLKRIENISHLTNLTTLDLSFNKIRSISPLGSCSFERLTRLYLSSNKIDVIEGISHFRSLKMLELGSNRIRTVPSDVGQLVNLEELWLGKNKIDSMALPPLPKLRHLSLQNNRLELWDATLFRNCPNLTHLYLGHNNLPDLPAEFGLLTSLMEVDLAKNAIATLRPLPEMEKLEELWLNDCQIADLAEVRHLASFPALKTVYLERNPMHGLGDPDSEQRYKEAILSAVPHLYQLDALRLNCKIKLITDGSEKNIMGIRKR